MIDSPKLWTLCDRPGLFRSVNSGETFGEIVATREGAPPTERGLRLVRVERIEQELARALGLTVVGDEESFVCDRCGRQVRSLVVTGERGVGACCSGD